MSRYATPACPLDAGHGRLLDWPTATAAWYCPSRRHEGEPAFYTTDLVPVPRSARGVNVPPHLARGPRDPSGRG